jgi:hypothetical protein
MSKPRFTIIRKRICIVTLRSLLKVAEKYAIDNSPTIISAFAVTGAAMTAYLTGKATFKAATIIAAEQTNQDFMEKGHPLETKEKIKLVWKEYIPPALMLVGTVGCILTANSISATRLAGLAAAYKVSEKQFDEYRDKVTEKLGIKKEQEIRDELNQDRFHNNPPSDDIQVLAGEDEVLFLEAWTGRYFRSKMHLVKMAEARLNHRMIDDMYVSLSDFYDEIGLARTQFSSEVGWTIESPMELNFTTTVADGGTKPCFVMEYYNRPGIIKDYHKGFGGTH